ncbi:unnamed protein product [Cochlearia groenlandica]
MAEQKPKKFTWVLKKFSSLQDEKCYSRTFFAVNRNWRLLAYPKGHNNGGYLCVFVELSDPESLPLGWRIEAKFSLTLVNKAHGKSNIVMENQCCFDETHPGWGYHEFVSLTKLHAKDQGFLVNNKIIIVAELDFLPVVVKPEETVKVIVRVGREEETQADDASAGNESQGNSSSQVVKKTEDSASLDNLDDDGSSETGSDDDDDDDDTSYEGTSEESSWEEVDGYDDGDVSSHVSDDGGGDISLLNQSNTFQDASLAVGNNGAKNNSVADETEISNDDAPNKDVDDEASSLVSNESAGNRSSLDQVKSLEDATQTSVTETANNLLMEIQTVKETMEFNGFEVFSSQVESVRRIFEKHPDIAKEFRAKNQHLRNACMNFLLSLIDTLCQSLEELSNEDLVEADIALTYLKDAGFKVDWLEKKLDQLKENKEREQCGLVKLKEIEEHLLILKLKCSEMDDLVEKEKADLLLTRTALSFDDLV